MAGLPKSAGQNRERVSDEHVPLFPKPDERVPGGKAIGLDSIGTGIPPCALRPAPDAMCP